MQIWWFLWTCVIYATCLCNLFLNSDLAQAQSWMCHFHFTMNTCWVSSRLLNRTLVHKRQFQMHGQLVPHGQAIHFYQGLVIHQKLFLKRFLILCYRRHGLAPESGICIVILPLGLGIKTRLHFFPTLIFPTQQDLLDQLLNSRSHSNLATFCATQHIGQYSIPWCAPHAKDPLRYQEEHPQNFPTKGWEGQAISPLVPIPTN